MGTDSARSRPAPAARCPTLVGPHNTKGQVSGYDRVLGTHRATRILSGSGDGMNPTIEHVFDTISSLIHDAERGGGSRR